MADLHDKSIHSAFATRVGTDTTDATDRGDHWAAAIDASSIGFAAIDVAREVVTTSRAFAKALGWSDMLAGESLRSWLKRFAAADAERLERALALEGATAIDIVVGPGQPSVRLQVAAHADSSRLIVLFTSIETAPAHILAAAEYDPLTGLGNRLALAAMTRQPDGAGKQTGIAVTIVDLDRFKQVNDTLGHTAGDHLLRLVAKRLRSIVRGNETVIRLGGDEFVILHTEGLHSEGARSVGRRVVELLGRPFIVDGHQVNIGASVGIAVSQPGINDSDEMLRRADLALYEAKSLGRGTYHLFEPRLAEQAQQRRDLEVSLRRALGLRQLSLHYQPQIDLSDGRITGFEALIRWQHPEHGMISPADFIPLAEEIGEIHPIGAWTLNEACREAAGWPGALSVAVNVSALQFEHGDIVATVRNALQKSGLAAQRLEIEITESVLLDHTEKLLDSLWALRDMGVGIAMDDFGTGYSSLSYLNRFPFSKLKIDQSFVRAEESRKSQVLVDAILGLGSQLGMTTIAEGIETQRQYETLARSGCASAQGYLISRPLPAERIASYLAGGNFTLPKLA